MYVVMAFGYLYSAGAITLAAILAYNNRRNP